MSAAHRPHPIGCLVAALALPGLGHLLLGMRSRAVQYFFAIVGTFAIGLVITQGYAVSWTDHPLAFVLQAPAGLPTAIGLMIDEARPATLGPTVPPDAVVAQLDLGLLFTMVAGLLNLLLIHDAYDRAASRRGGQ